MIEKLRYVCEKCGAEYIEQENAEACEARHIAPAQIIEAYYPKFSSLQTINYPIRIRVEMEDGKVVVFERAKDGRC